jgi:hypothetical protein
VLSNGSAGNFRSGGASAHERLRKHHHSSNLNASNAPTSDSSQLPPFTAAPPTSSHTTGASVSLSDSTPLSPAAASTALCNELQVDPINAVVRRVVGGNNAALVGYKSPGGTDVLNDGEASCKLARNGPHDECGGDFFTGIWISLYDAGPGGAT